MADVSQYPKESSLLPGKGGGNLGGLPKPRAQCHAEWARTADKDKGAVVFLGEFHYTRLASRAQACLSQPEGCRSWYRGRHEERRIYRLKAVVLDLDPKAIVLLIGTNDMGNGAEPEEVADNLEAILQEKRKLNPNLPVIVCEVMPRSDRNQQSRPTGLKNSTRWSRRQIKNYPQFTLCDT